MRSATPGRVASLDLIRGVAVLGILAINIVGFAGPSAASLSPGAILPAEPLDEAAFAFGFLLFEGKMRALFTILFGASMMLFIENAEARGEDGDLLQFRRLCWLMVLGQLHYFALWWGDILFAYAACGMIALMLRQMSIGAMLTVALAVFVSTHALAGLEAWPSIAAEEAVRQGSAALEQSRAHAGYLATIDRMAARELALYQGDFMAIAGDKLRENPFWLLEMTWSNIGETLPLTLVGAALHRSGFFAGQWPRRVMLGVAVGATLAGLLVTLAALAWAWPREFPIVAMNALLRTFLALPHFVTALGYAAILVLATRRITSLPLGRWIADAGRMALSNYIATSLIMTAIFYGWGLGLFGTVGPAWQWAFVLGGWATMLVFSHFWLARFRRGPLEWLWRSLTERRILANH